MKKLLLLTLLALSSLLAQARPTDPSVSVNAEKWVLENFSKGKQPPFSFLYNGKSSRGFITHWKHSLRMLSDSCGVVKYEARYTDPLTQLEVKCEITAFRDYQAVEWLPRFTNLGSEPSGQISCLQATDVELAPCEKFKVHHSLGSECHLTDFMPTTDDLQGSGASLRLASTNGRSSHGTLPFFNIETSHGGEYSGVITAIGWTGSWISTLSVDKKGGLSLRAGQAVFDAYLRAGESVRTPRTCLLFWQGDNPYAGNNRFRRFMYEQRTHRIEGKPTKYPISFGFSEESHPQKENIFQVYEFMSEQLASAIISQEELYGLHPENYWMDAGWNTNSQNVGWAYNVGTWTIDKERYPNGLKPVSDAAHKVGCKFTVWMEPERVAPGSQWRKEHPSWMLHYVDAEHPAETKAHPEALFNLADPEARLWLTETISKLYQDNAIDNYRQDFNTNPDVYWYSNDEKGRSGILEAKYIEGLYAFWDGLLSRNPSMLIDNCSAGGRRIDYEMCLRSAPLWRSDADCEDNSGTGPQNFGYGLNLYLPQHGGGCKRANQYLIRSSLGSALIFNWSIFKPENSLEMMRQGVKDAYEYRERFIKDDYYPLVGENQNLARTDIWLAYQLNAAEDGVVMAFRRQDCREDTLRVRLYGLQDDARYEISNVDTGQKSILPGEELSDPARGLVISAAEPQTALIIKYRRVK